LARLIHVYNIRIGWICHITNKMLHGCNNSSQRTRNSTANLASRPLITMALQCRIDSAHCPRTSSAAWHGQACIGRAWQCDCRVGGQRYFAQCSASAAAAERSQRSVARQSQRRIDDLGKKSRERRDHTGVLRPSDSLRAPLAQQPPATTGILHPQQ
jgi:hypothetical protein